MDKCVCGKQPRIRSGLQMNPVQAKLVCAASSPHTHTVYVLQMEYEHGATNLFQHLRQRHKELYDQCMAKKIKIPGHPFFFFLPYVCSGDILLHLYLVIILPYVCSRDMLQLFAKALIGFLLEIHFKFTLNAFMTVKHVCVSKSKSQNWSKKSQLFLLSISHSPNSTVVLCIVCNTSTCAVHMVAFGWK